MCCSSRLASYHCCSEHLKPPSPVSPGLSKLPSEEAKQLAFDLAQRWIRTNWKAYEKYDAMFEKVNLERFL